MDPILPERKRLPHDVPSWVENGAVFFITLNAKKRGSAPLVEQNRPAGLWDSAQEYCKQGLWWPHLFLVMPDHLHLLACFARTPGMKHTMNGWKRWTARSMGIKWQRDFFDHRIRHSKEYDEKAFYIRQNPVRKQLALKPEDWPYVWDMSEAQQTGS